MKGRRRAGVLAGACLAAWLVPGLTAANPACAAAGAHAALVVDTGAAELRMCVALPESQVSGLEVIALAHEQHGLAYSLGFGGNAVCSLAGVGSTSDDCFEEYPDFWGYWRGLEGGGWSWSGVGPASTVVGDGDVEG